MLIIILTLSTSWGCHDDQMRRNRSKSALKNMLTPQTHGGMLDILLSLWLLWPSCFRLICLWGFSSGTLGTEKKGASPLPLMHGTALKGVCWLKDVNNLFPQSWFSLQRNEQLLPPFFPNTHEFLSSWEIQLLYIYNHFTILGACWSLNKLTKVKTYSSDLLGI